ncbi:unnamed protein product, partial [Notodromas monacha]
MANPDDNMDVVNVFAAAAMVEAENEEPGNPNGNVPNKHEERTVRFPTIATNFMNELEKLSLDSWKRLVECLAVIKNEFLCDRMIEGSQASLNRKKAKLMSVEEEHVKLAQSETTMVTTLNARRRLIEDSNKAETAAMTRLRKAFTAITKVDQDHLLQGFTEPTELFLSLNNNDKLKNMGDTIEIKLGNLTLHVGKERALEKIWRESLKLHVEPDLERTDMSQMEVIEGGTINLGTIKASAVFILDKEDPKEKENKVEVIMNPSAIALGPRTRDGYGFVHLSMIFRISKFFPISPPNYFANVAAEMGLTHEIYGELKGKSIDLPIPGTIVDNYKFSTEQTPIEGEPRRNSSKKAIILISTSMCSTFHFGGKKDSYRTRVDCKEWVHYPVMDVGYMVDDLDVEILQ